MRKVNTIYLVVLLLALAISANAQTWQQVAHVNQVASLQAHDIEALLDPAPGTYLAVTDQGIYRSTDAGIHWSSPWGPSGGIIVGGGALFSHPNGRIFAGMDNGLAVSTDMGVSWSMVPGHPSFNVCRITRDSLGRMFTAAWGNSRSEPGGVYRSTDNGVTWSRMLDSAYVEIVEQIGDSVLFAGGYKWLGRSRDGGLTWEVVYNTAGIRSVTVTPDGSILFGWYLTDPSLRQATYRSTNNGATWGSVAGFFPEYFARDANNFIYAACDSGFRKTTDNGASWQVMNTGLLNREGKVPWLRTVNRIGTNELIAGEYHTGEIFRSTDLGAHWSTISLVEYPNPTSPKISALTIKDPATLFIGSSGYGMKQWTAGGGVVDINSGLGNLTINAVYVDRTGSIFAATAGGMYRSTNDGVSWAKFGTTTVNMRAVGDLATGEVLGGVANGVVKFTPDGATMTVMTAGLVNKLVNTLWTGRDDRTFVGTNDGIYQLSGTIWTPVPVSTGPLKVTDIKVDRHVMAIATADSGVYISTDSGKVWQKKLAGIEGKIVRSLVVGIDTLYAATELNGVYKSTTGSAAWTPYAQGLNETIMRGLVLSTDGYLYSITDSGAVSKTLASVKVGIRETEPVMPTAFALEQNYPNPFNPNTVVSSQLPVASNVKLVVYDVLGQEVAVLVNERRAAGRYQDVFDGKGVASGVYIYRLTAGAFTQVRKMVLLK